MAHPKRNRPKLDAELAVLLKKGRHQKAAVVVRAILEEDRDDDRLWVKLAELCLKGNDEEGVRGAFRGAAAAAERKGFYLRAMAALRQLARYQPPAERPWSELANLAMRLSLVGDALGFLDEGIRAWEAEGDRPSVLQAVRRCHELAPDDVHRTLRLVLELRRDSLAEEGTRLLATEAARHRAAGRPDAWLTLAAELSSLIPDDRALACEVASAFLDRGEPRKALQRLQPAMREASKHLDSLRLVIRAFEAMGHAVKRLAAVRELARTLSSRGRQEAARPHWEALLAADDGDAEARRALGLQPAALPTPTPAPVLALAPLLTPPPTTPLPAAVLAAARTAPDAEDEEVISLGDEGVEVVEAGVAVGAYADLSDDLAHAQFLVTHRFTDEARDLLAALQAGHPGHPEVAALLARLEAGPELVPAHPAPAATTLPPPAPRPEARPLPAPEPAGEPVELESLGGVELVPAETVLAQFRAQVALAVAPDDAATHYDLGIAYREMGLASEAQAEFELASASPTSPRAVDALIGVALCQAGRGEPAAAARTLKRAMTHPALTPVGSAAVLYELGALREQDGDAGGAARAYRSAEKAQPRFRDAAARAERLEPGELVEDDAVLGLLPSGA